MRRVLSLLVLAHISASTAADVVTVYRNAGPDGTCACSTAANPLATAVSSSPASGPGAIAAGAPAAAVANAGSKTPTYSYDGSSVASSGQTSAFSSGYSSVITTQALTYPFSAANSYNPATEAAQAAAQTGTQPIGFQIAVSSVFINLQLWFQVVIQGATGVFNTEIGAGGLAIDYINANKYFSQIGPLISPGATVFVTTSVTQTVSSIVATATTTVPGGAGVDSGSRPTTSIAVTGTNSTSSVAGPTSLSSSTSGVTVVPVSTTSSSMGQPAPATNQFILLDSNGRPFSCENGTLQVQPVGSTGDVVSINPNTTLTCGGTEAYVEQTSTGSPMRRRDLAGRAVTNSTDYFSIKLAPFEQIPAFASVFGFSVSSSELKLVVNGTSLGFALSLGTLIAYDPAKGPPASASTLEIGASSTSSAASTMSTFVSATSSLSNAATGTTSAGTTSTGVSSSSGTTTSSVSMSITSSQTTTSASQSVSSTNSMSSSLHGNSTVSSPTSSFSTNGTSTSASSSSASASSSASPEVTTNGCSLDATTEKRVFAHMLVGNNYNYVQSDYYNDFAKAAALGIDGMALNVGAESWQLQSTALAYAAAQQLSSAGSCFKVFVSLDMTSLNANVAPNGSYVTPYVQQFKSHPAQFYYQNRHFVSTYGGYQQFNWTSTFINPLLQQGIDVYFVPAYSIQTYAAAAYATEESSGQFLWNAWPNDASTGLPTDSYISPALSQEYINNKGNKTFMANVSPWFFTHYDNSVKNFVFKSEGLWQQRWSQLAGLLRSGTDFVQITSWNDWGESHYIGPVGPQNPDTSYYTDAFGYNCQTWLEVNNDPYPSGANDGFGGYLDHGSFGDEAKAWIAAYKTGSAITVSPLSAAAPVAQSDLDSYYQTANSDRAYVSYRLQYKNATTVEPSSREPNGGEYAEDVIVLDAYISGNQNATANIAFGIYDGNSTSGASEAYSIPPGVSQTFIPFRNLKSGGDGGRRCGAVSLSIGTVHGYTIEFGDLKPIMTAALAASSNITYNAFAKKTTGYNATA